ncbi:MAG: SusC/RagA family TonB-linked outer membrane protein [Bacteroidetes bacterium]|nr:SusC/RagA family TonB-linked outer membrane protein [Bacteroidota bacterium]
MIKQLFFSFCLVLGIISTLNAQQTKITVSGTVKSFEDGSTLPFVTVAIKGTTEGVKTDFDGKYTLKNVSPTDTLVFSFVGYQPQKTGVNNQSVINVSLHVTASVLKEVVVTALGVSRQTREVGYSTQKVDGSDLQRSNSSNIISAMSGKSAGVQIANPDGVDGGTTRITIRGNNNISGKNQPLIVVDGTPIENDPGFTYTNASSKTLQTGVDWGSAINNINAQDIEDINILKGGAASALYGSRGANGVILITTKKGKKQKGIGVTYNVSYKITIPYLYRDVQNKYGYGGPNTFGTQAFRSDTINPFPQYSTSALRLDAQGNTISSNALFGSYGGSVSWGPQMNGDSVRWWDGSIRFWSPQPDNQALAYKNGYTVSHNIALEGGTERASMRVSISMLDNQPIIYNSEYNQTTISLNSSLKVSEKVNVVATASYLEYHRLNSPDLGDSWDGFSKGMLYSWPRSYQGEDFYNYQFADGSRNPNNGYPYLYVNKDLWWKYFNNNTTLDRNKLMGGLALNYNIMPWLSFTARTGLDFQLDEYTTKNKPTDVLGLLNGYYSNSLKKDRSTNNEFLFTFSKDSILNSEVNVKFNIGGSSWERNIYGINGNSGKLWYYPNMYSFLNYTQPDTSRHVTGDQLLDVKSGESLWRKRINSIYSFVNLSYKNYLFVDITGRWDCSSALPYENKYDSPVRNFFYNSYFYPSLTLSFIPFEAFNYKNDWISFLKVRGGASQTATDTDPYQTSFAYTSTMYGGNQSAGYPSTVPPIALKPQRVNSYEFGTNIEFLNGKIALDFTYYYVYSKEQIIQLPVPISSGASQITTNEGVLTNRGIEIILNTTPYHTKDFTFKTGLNFSRNRNKVLSLGGITDDYPIANIWGTSGPMMILHSGDDFGTISGWDYVKDANGNRIVNDKGTEYIKTASRVPIGNASPKFTAGWSMNFRYKDFTLSTLVDTKWGGDIYSGSYAISLQTGQSPETLLERDGGGLPYTDPYGHTSNIGVVLQGVHQDGTPNTTVVHYYYKYLNAGGWGPGVLTTPAVLENTWVKCREIAFSYTLPAKYLKQIKIFQELSFSIVGRDLFYIYKTLPDNINPEGILGAGDAQGFEWASMPGTRSFSFQINAKF